MYSYTSNNDSYNNYELSDGVYSWGLSSKDMLILDAGIYLVDNNTTLRDTSDNFRVSASTLSKYFRDDLKLLSYELYQVVQRKLRNNKNRYFS